jgi:hypothetical protein
VAGNCQDPAEPPESSRPSDPGNAGENDQKQPYQGKHRVPQPQSPGLKARVAKMVLDQPPGAPQPMPDTPGDAAPDFRGDQQALDRERCSHDDHR